jgi:hypothetical protein
MNTPTNNPDAYLAVTRKGRVLVGEDGNEYALPYWYTIQDGAEGVIAKSMLQRSRS